ncbi:MAG: DHH family phosphoesterase [Candidatus Micrarchaeota archaeon]|nr:DHH family phosphoesterase [Candidatus Micrarchaeota archaeon]
MKITILTHSDCDGICAGAIALSRFPHAEVFFTKPASFADDLEECTADKIIVCDIALTQKDKERIMHIIKEKPAKISYFDHHPLDERTKQFLDKHIDLHHDLNRSASEIIYRHFENDIPPERVWIAIYGAIGDYCDDTEFVKRVEKDWDIRALYFEVSTLVLGIKVRHFESYDKKRDIVKALSKGLNPSDVPGLAMGAKEAVNAEFDLYEIVKKRAEKLEHIGIVKDLEGFGFRGPAALFAATVTDSILGMSIYDRTNHFDITVRTRDYSIDLNVLLSETAEEFEGTGGGHPQAGGARVPIMHLNAFLKRINEKLDEMIK